MYTVMNFLVLFVEDCCVILLSIEGKNIDLPLDLHIFKPHNEK